MITLESMYSFQAKIAYHLNKLDGQQPEAFSREAINDVVTAIISDRWTKYERATWGRGA